MGIADLWPVVSPACESRISFQTFLSQFIERNGRPPRFAIDAYMFIYYSQLPDVDPNDKIVQSRTIRNFMAKLWYFVQHNILFVVVFDGRFKPGKLRNGHLPEIPGSINYDEILAFFRKVDPIKYSENLSLVEKLKVILQRNCMDIVQAPGEAEAECAWLQKLGVVDYVISDDSDTLVFGATQMIRSFNRVKYTSEDGKPVLSNTDYYVTPVHMDKVVEMTGLDRNRLVLLAVLRGGDYSSGAESIGITRAKEIALCGTPMLLSLPRKALQDFGAFPDFSKKFVETFVDQEKAQRSYVDPWAGLKLELDRTELLNAFNSYLDSFLRQEHKGIFGRLTTFKSKVNADEYYALLYFFPLVNRKVFKFMPNSTSFGELKAIENDLPGVLPSAITQVVKRYNYVCNYKDIGVLVVDGDKMTFSSRDSALRMEQEVFALPRERHFNLKSFVLKLLRSPKFAEEITLARVKKVEDIELGVLKFNKTRLHDVVYLVLKKDAKNQADGDADEDSNDLDDPNDPDSLVSRDNDEDDEKVLSIAVPLNAISLVAPKFVSDFRKRQSPNRKSPRKKIISPQKTTLDALWPGMSPSKKPKATETISLDSDEDLIELPSPSKNERAGSPSRRRRKMTLKERYELKPGQKTVTSYFKNPSNSNPFQQLLFVNEDEEESNPEDFLKMKNVILGAPKLEASEHSSKALVDTRLSSPELSPTKKSRMNLSPDNSPLKAKKEPDTENPPS